MRYPVFPTFLSALVVVLFSATAAANDREDLIYGFLDSYCMECHDMDVQKAHREFDSFALPLEKTLDLISAQEIIDQVTLNEMPPKKADQPTEQERIAVVRALRESITEAKDRFASTGGKTVLRRLSSREYEKTLEVLFGRRVDTLGLTADFPNERASKHMDNIGKSLVTSGFLLDEYFSAADRLVETRLNQPPIEPQTWHFTDNFVQYEELTGSHRAVFKFQYLNIYEQPNSDTRQGAYAHIEDFLEGVPASGYYDLEVLVQGMHRDTHYDAKIFRIDFSEPFIMGIVPGDVRAGHIHYPQSVEPILATGVVPDDEPEWLRFRVWLEKGQTPRFIWPNGPYESRASVIQVNKRYGHEFSKPPSTVSVSRTMILREGKLPHIRISEVKVHGPIPEKGGAIEELAVFGEEGFQEENPLDSVFVFAERAFRRPLTDQDRSMIRQIFIKRIAAGESRRQASLDAIKMILCSPSFIYLQESAPDDQPMLGAYDLAARLSYTLWAAPPDYELTAAAASGELLTEDGLALHIDRMLADEEQSRGFIEAFAGSWLNYRELGGMPPPRKAAAVYYYQDLPKSMKEETYLFMEHLLHSNGSVLDFLDSDYTFADKYLAQLYNLPEGKEMRLADGFQKVSLPKNEKRGGLLGMAGVLTVSANGVETSPVTRGVWIGENLLGMHLPPPPDEVPEIDSDTRGAKTIREKLEKHRSIKTCAECHRKIDPLGFALEEFNPIGQRRAKYPPAGPKKERLPVDSSGVFASGEKFVGPTHFRSILRSTRSEQFTRHLISQFLTYATGRHMEGVDRIEIDEIVERVRKQDYGMRTLVKEALKSEIFRSR